MDSFAVTVPYNAYPGTTLQVTSPSGETFMVLVPQNVRPGTIMMVPVNPPAQNTGPVKPDQVINSNGTTVREGVDPSDLCSICGLCCVIL